MTKHLQQQGNAHSREEYNVSRQENAYSRDEHGPSRQGHDKPIKGNLSIGWQTTRFYACTKISFEILLREAHALYETVPFKARLI